MHAKDLYGVCALDDPNNRTLTGRFEAKEDMTVEMCLSICRNDGFPYAGLEWQIECYCGDEPDLGFIWSWPNKCNEKCAGDSYQNCGGSNAISIWSTPPAYLTGQCFYDFPSPQRVFEHGYSIDGLEDLTPEKCIEICRSDEGTDLILILEFLGLELLEVRASSRKKSATVKFYWRIRENLSRNSF